MRQRDIGMEVKDRAGKAREKKTNELHCQQARMAEVKTRPPISTISIFLKSNLNHCSLVAIYTDFKGRGGFFGRDSEK